MGAFEMLKERGFLYQSTHDEELAEYLKKPRKFYVGFDPTADSLHVGSLVPIMAMVHMQRAGHMPLALIGGGTARIGDPSGKQEMRKMLTDSQIENNETGIAAQLGNYLRLDGQTGHLVNNKDWLLGLNYIGFLRDFGVCFSVNRMMTMESVKLRLDNEAGLSFLEFNYMILQAFDFYHLAETEDCYLQMGGQDQWGNIISGIDLIRRKGEGNQQAYGFTWPLITKSDGTKFGKSESGNVWLDKNRTGSFEFYQFWRNTEDHDVARYMGLFTLLPMDEIKQLTAEGANINRAKEILAYEATRLAHGEEEAGRAYSTAVSKFGAADPEGHVVTSSAISGVNVGANVDLPSIEIPAGELPDLSWVKLLVRADLAKSNGEARRLISGRGARAGEAVIEDGESPLSADMFPNGELILRAGKKRFKQILLR